MHEEIKTPLTDAQEFDSREVAYVPAYFARNLDRRLSIAKAALEEIHAMKGENYGDHWSHQKALNFDYVKDITEAALSQLAK